MCEFFVAVFLVVLRHIFVRSNVRFYVIFQILILHCHNGFIGKLIEQGVCDKVSFRKEFFKC